MSIKFEFKSEVENPTSLKVVELSLNKSYYLKNKPMSDFSLKILIFFLASLMIKYYIDIFEGVIY